MRDQSRIKTKKVLLGLGSNLDPEHNIRSAIDLLKTASRVLKTASIWQSPAFGHIGPDYLNTAVLIETDLSIEDLRSTLLRPIEDQLGRIRGPEKFSDRTIDLDVLVYNKEVCDQEIWHQAHTSIPASELLPELINPDSGLTLLKTADNLKNISEIQIRSDLQFS